MGFFWTSKSDKTQSATSPLSSETGESKIPSDLADYLEKKESKLSDREFKDLLRRQSEQHSLPSVEEEIKRKHEKRNINVIENNMGSGNQQEVPFIDLPHQPIEKPKAYISLDVETYRRQNDIRESVLINCSEIQSQFYKCLAKQSTWDRLQSVGRLQSDDCTALADFFVACSDVQKQAFGVFDYEMLDTIDEMNTARRTVDKIFSESFNNVEDVRDRIKFNEYTKRLRREREEFHQRFDK